MFAVKVSRLAAACSVLVAALASAPATASPTQAGRIRSLAPRGAAVRSHGDALTRARENGRLSAAQYALERAKSLWRLQSVRARWGRITRPGPRDATLILRDLALAYDDLSPSEQAAADLILARPTQGAGDPDHNGYDSGLPVQNLCSAHFCMHWVESSSDAVSAADGDANGHPDYIDQAQTVLDNVWRVEIETLGFRPPESDADSPDNGGDEKLDVYFADVGAKDIFGFCGSDDPDIQHIGGSGPADISAYCVLDNDFNATQFPGETSLEAMEVTAAHEFFHAVQFAYDALEDVWLLEGTATWMEDVVYDDVNDYYQYLPASQMGLFSGIPLDFSSRDDTKPISSSRYGASLFFHFLSDAVFGTQSAPDRSYMRALWDHADSTRGAGNNEYSLEAVESVLAERGTNFTDTYARFAVANALPSSFYGEGGSYGQAAHVSATTFRITAARPQRGGGTQLDHLTSVYADFRPGKGVTASSRLRVSFNGPPLPTGTAGAVAVLTRSAGPTFNILTPNAAGDVTLTTTFGKGRVTDVVVVLTNASTALTCGRNQLFSCEGLPTYDDQPYRVTAKLLR